MTIKRWLGNAASVADLWTVSLSGSSGLQTYTLTINGKSISYAASGADSISTVLLALQSLWNSSSNPPEFLELTAVALPVGGPYTSLTLTQNTSGRPTAISVSTSGSASFSIANTAVATGPSFFDNAQNWSGGVAPANSDTLIFDSGNTPCCYNINSSLTGITLEIQPGYSGSIGLPLLNTTGATAYSEYRTTFLSLVGGTVIINAPQVQQCNIGFGANAATVRVLSTSTQRLSPQIPVVLLTGGNSSSNLYITQGDVATAFYQGETAQFASISTGYAQNPLTDVLLTIGSGTTLVTLTKNGGNVTLLASPTTVNQDVAGGTLTVSDSAAIGTLNASNGTVYFNSVGTLTTCALNGSTIFSCDGDPRGKTITTLTVYSSSVTITDNQKSVNSGTLTIASSGITGCIVNHGENTTMTFA